MILVPLSKFLERAAATAVGTSNRRHWLSPSGALPSALLISESARHADRPYPLRPSGPGSLARSGPTRPRRRRQERVRRRAPLLHLVRYRRLRGADFAALAGEI